MALFRASVSGLAPLIVQLTSETNVGVGGQVKTVTFVSDRGAGEARFPQIYVPTQQGILTAGGRRKIRGASEGGSSSQLMLITEFSSMPSLPDSIGAPIQELPYYSNITYPPGQELVVPPGGALVFYAYSPAFARAGHTWSLIVEWQE